jgi:hypothetical protein
MSAIQRHWPRALVTRQNTGAARDATGRVIRFGTPGQADIRVILHGQAVEIEVKTPTGRQSKHQKNWQRSVERAGGIYILARSADEAVEKIVCQLKSKQL